MVDAQVSASPAPLPAGACPGGLQDPTNGQVVLALLQALAKRLVSLQADVLADRDQEPLHQLRVSLRRLRTVVVLFAPLLQLPEAVAERRIARVGRALGLARDLDVLQGRLRKTLLPALPSQEAEALGPVLRQLRRQRRRAQAQVDETLRSGRYLKLLARLQQWLREPRLSPLAAEPLELWLGAWQSRALGGLVLEPGWWVPSPQDDPEALHGLRKRCKSARYGLEALLPHTGAAGQLAVFRLHAAQDRLGELTDWQVLREVIQEQGPQHLEQQLPTLAALLQQHQQEAWQRWRLLAQELQTPVCRSQMLQPWSGPAASQGAAATATPSVAQSPDLNGVSPVAFEILAGS